MTSLTNRPDLESNAFSARENTERMSKYNKANLGIESPIEEIDSYKKLALDTMMDTLWERVFYVSSMDGPAVTTTSSAELFSGATRQSDTSSGKFLSVRRPCKFRCLFYFNGTDATDSTAYIGTAGTSTTDTGITSINQDGMEYAALKIEDGAVTIKTRSASGFTEKATGRTITDDTTYILEINFSPNERADFFLDNDYLGSITDFIPGESVYKTFFPMMVSLKRSSGTNTKVTVESWEFIQLKE